MGQHHNSFSLFQTAVGLEGQIRRRTEQLTNALSHLERANEELVRQKEISERANLSKTRFLAAASHDVLQPLHASKLLLSALGEMQSDVRAKNLLEQTERALDSMQEVLRTLLDISQLDAGAIKPIMEPLNLREFICNTVEEFIPIARRCNLIIKTKSPDITINTDQAMLRGILRNLVSNAIRYTENGGAIVGVRVRSGRAMIEVSDTGVGIAECQFEKIFEEFNRGEQKDSLNRDHGAGLGLGLAIVSRLADTMHYNISIKSKLGKGSTFRVLTGPVVNCCSSKRVVASTRFSVPQSKLSGGKILLVENNPRVLLAMSTLLNSWKCDVLEARSMTEVVKKLSSSPWQPDVIIADQHLDQDELGTELINFIRDTYNLNLPSIIVTADPSEEIFLECKKMRVELMLKPIKPAQLRALLFHLIGAG